MTSSDPATPMGTVLIVDDDPGIRTLLMDVLIDGGYTVCSAVDGAAAVKSFVENRPDLILLDVNMPRLRGIETLLVIRELSPGTPVVMISGIADEAEARRALALGAFDYVSKPFDLTYLCQVIETAL